MRRIGRVAKDAAKVTATEFVEEGVSQAAASAMKLSGDWWSVDGERMFTTRGELESFIEAMEQTAKYGFWQILPGFAANRALRGGGGAPAALRAEGISQARDGTARLRMRGVTLHDATAAEIAAQAARETRSSARMSGVPLKVIKDWKEGMTQEERERVIGEQELTEEQVATLDATAHARALAEAAGDQTLTLEEEVVEINRQIEKLGEADEDEAVQMLNAELQAEEEAKRSEEAKKREGTKAKEETPKENEGLPRAAEEKPDAGGEAAGRELEALRVRAAELDDRLRRKGLRKAERNKIAEELAGVQARMQELSGGNLVLFSRGDGAQGRPALSPTKAALRDRLLLKIAQTAGIRIVRERSAQILGSARNAEVRRRLGGYMGTAWSARANDALERGLRPAPMIADELGVSAEAVEAYMRSPEWHHVGEDFEEVRFFDPDEAPLTDADAVEDAETAQSFLTYVDMFNYDTRKFSVEPRVRGKFEAEASDKAYALFTNRSTAVAKDAFAAADKLRALIEGGTATAEELRAAAEEASAAAKSGRKASDAAAKRPPRGERAAVFSGGGVSRDGGGACGD